MKVLLNTVHAKEGKLWPLDNYFQNFGKKIV